MRVRMIVSADRPDAGSARTASSEEDIGDAFAKLVWRQEAAGEGASAPRSSTILKINNVIIPAPLAAPVMSSAEGSAEAELVSEPDAQHEALVDTPAEAVGSGTPTETRLSSPVADGPIRAGEPAPVAHGGDARDAIVDTVLGSGGQYEAASLMPAGQASLPVKRPQEADADEPASTTETRVDAGAAMPTVPASAAPHAYDARIRRLLRSATLSDMAASPEVGGSVIPSITPESSAAPPSTRVRGLEHPAPAIHPNDRLRFTEVITAVRTGQSDGPVVPLNLGRATFDAATQAIVHSHVEARDHVAPAIGEMWLRADVAAIMAQGPQPSKATAVTPAAEAVIATEPEAFIKDLAGGIARDFKSGQRWLDIRLDPAELGRIDVRMTLDAKGHVQAVIAADNPSTFDLLRREAPALVRALQDAGVQTNGDMLKFDLRSDMGRDQQQHRHHSARVSDDKDERPATTEGGHASPARGQLI